MANSINCLASPSSVQQLAKYFKIVVEGGVVMSKNLVNMSRTDTAGSLSCLSHVLTAPIKIAKNEIIFSVVFTSHYMIMTEKLITVSNIYKYRELVVKQLILY